MSKKGMKGNDSTHKIDQEIFQPPIKKSGTPRGKKTSQEKNTSNQVRMSTSHGKATPVTMVTQCGLIPESGEEISIFSTEKTVILPHRNINSRSKSKK